MDEAEELPVGEVSMCRSILVDVYTYMYTCTLMYIYRFKDLADSKPDYAFRGGKKPSVARLTVTQSRGSVLFGSRLCMLTANFERAFVQHLVSILSSAANMSKTTERQEVWY